MCVVCSLALVVCLLLLLIDCGLSFVSLLALVVVCCLLWFVIMYVVCWLLVVG